VDGWQYMSLASELATAQRFAIGRGDPPSYTRMPGYPLFLAFAAARGEPITDVSIRRAAVANALLDVATALLVMLLLLELRRGWAAPVVGLVLVVLCPLLLVLASHVLSESLATCLAVLALYLAVRATRTRPLLHAGLCGVVTGLAQLLRADAASLAPALALLLWLAVPERRRKAALLGLWAGVGAARVRALAHPQPGPFRRAVPGRRAVAHQLARHAASLGRAALGAHLDAGSRRRGLVRSSCFGPSSARSPRRRWARSAATWTPPSTSTSWTAEATATSSPSRTKSSGRSSRPSTKTHWKTRTPRSKSPTPSAASHDSSPLDVDVSVDVDGRKAPSACDHRRATSAMFRTTGLGRAYELVTSLCVSSR
jgi:hypothetical protein